MSDEYLWDRSGPVDAEVAALEEALGKHRFRGGELPRLEARPGPRRLTSRVLVFAAAASLALAAGLYLTGTDRSPYHFETLSGTPTVAGASRADGELGFGESLVCDDTARARIHIGDIGSLELEAGSRISVRRSGELPNTDDAGFVLDLERGSILASIFATPRLFQLGTPAGLAVDMGCVYRASVEPDGTTLLSVVTGLVSFETLQRRVLVPEGALARSYPERGPGTPVWEDATEALRGAARALDEGRGDPESHLATILDTRREKDSLTLWHLLDPIEGVEHSAERVYAQLVSLVPVPDGVTRAGVLDGNETMRERWKQEFSWDWGR